MAFVSKVNQAGLFANDRAPEKSDYTGQIEIMCPKCGVSSHWWISGWRKTAKSGVKYLSLALRPKGAPAGQERTGAAGTSSAGDNRDIPFITNIDISPDRRFRI